MTNPLRCPNCGLLSPDEAIACDCGHRFDAPELSRYSRTEYSATPSFSGLPLVPLLTGGWLLLALIVLSLLQGVNRSAGPDAAIGVGLLTLGSLLVLGVFSAGLVFFVVANRQRLTSAEILLGLAPSVLFVLSLVFLVLS